MGRVALLLAVLAGCGFAPSGGDGDASFDRDGAPDDAGLGDGTTDPDAPGPDALDASPDAATTPGCPGDYLATLTGTYRLVTPIATWEAARADCADDLPPGDMHTHLVVFATDAERIAARAAFPGPKLWIGLSDRVDTLVWRWVTAEDTGTYPPATGTPWKGGQPNDGAGGQEDCTLMEGSGLWDDRKCDADTEAYLCECDPYPEDPNRF